MRISFRILSLGLVRHCHFLLSNSCQRNLERTKGKRRAHLIAPPGQVPMLDLPIDRKSSRLSPTRRKTQQSQSNCNFLPRVQCVFSPDTFSFNYSVEVRCVSIGRRIARQLSRRTISSPAPLPPHFHHGGIVSKNLNIFDESRGATLFQTEVF